MQVPGGPGAMAEASGSPAVVEAPVCGTPQPTSSAAAPTTNALASTLPRASREPSPIAREKKVKTPKKRVAPPEVEHPLHAELGRTYREGRHKDLRKKPCVNTVTGEPYEGGLCPTYMAHSNERKEAKSKGEIIKGPYRHDDTLTSQCCHLGKRKRAHRK